jgi:hypothetical protein
MGVIYAEHKHVIGFVIDGNDGLRRGAAFQLTCEIRHGISLFEMGFRGWDGLEGRKFRCGLAQCSPFRVEAMCGSCPPSMEGEEKLALERKWPLQLDGESLIAVSSFLLIPGEV